MNLASFYLCLFFSEAALKCDIVGKEENYKYLVALYTYHFYFFCFFFFVVVASLFLGDVTKTGSGERGTGNGSPITSIQR